MANYAGRKLKTTHFLPFAVSAEDRIKTFTRDMERAAIVYLAESSRKRGEGHILKKPEEKLVFITEACYPIWLVPWNEGTLLFDGLNVTAHTLYSDKLPDIKVCEKDIRRSKKTYEAYSMALSRNANYFKNLAGKEEKTIEGLITAPEFIQDFSVYLLKEKEAEKALMTRVVLYTTINKSEISASVKKLSDMKAKIDEEIGNLNLSMKLLNLTTGEKVIEIRKEIKTIRRKFDKRIAKAKPAVTKRIRQIQKRYDLKITRISKRFERKLRFLHENQVKLEKTQKRLRNEIRRYETKIESYRSRKNKKGEIKWTRKLKETTKKLPTFEKGIRDANKEIGKLETARKLEVSQQRIECDTRSEEAKKILRDLEASREARIRMKQQEIASLKDSTSRIIKQMNEMTKLKNAALNEFERIRMPKKEKACKLVYLPFYLVRYEMEAENRYVIYPPSIVSGMGILTKMKGVLGVEKMKAFLQPRSKAITLFLDQVLALIQRNSMFEKELTDAGIQDSILRIRKTRIGVKRGLRELKNENWLSKSELQTLGKLLYIHA